MRWRRDTPPPLFPPDGIGEATAIAVCHPDWRGVRAAAHAHDDPVIETAMADVHAADILDAAVTAGASTIVVHGWPPGAGTLLGLARDRGLDTRAVLHSSPAQHGAESGEAEVADGILELARAGVIGRVGCVKAGVAEALVALGHDVVHTPNRTPRVGDPDRVDLGPGVNVGVFGEAFWRKNVVTQLAAAALLTDATVHTLQPPPVRYLAALPVRVHGVLPREEFLRVQASVDLTLYVTLSECHPLTPIESYLLGVPCLMSRTSDVFADDPDLWSLTTTDRADDPRAIAAAAERLLADGDHAVSAARSWIERADVQAADRWRTFLV